MKRKLISISSVLAAVLLLLPFGGCNNKESSDNKNLVGAWLAESAGEYDDIITTELILDENGSATITWSSNKFEETESLGCKWKLDGKELVFTDPSWEGEDLRHEYNLVGDLLVLDPNDNCYFVFARK